MILQKYYDIHSWFAFLFSFIFYVEWADVYHINIYVCICVWQTGGNNCGGGSGRNSVKFQVQCLMNGKKCKAKQANSHANHILQFANEITSRMTELNKWMNLWSSSTWSSSASSTSIFVRCNWTMGLLSCAISLLSLSLFNWQGFFHAYFFAMSTIKFSIHFVTACVTFVPFHLSLCVHAFQMLLRARIVIWWRSATINFGAYVQWMLKCIWKQLNRS